MTMTARRVLVLAGTVLLVLGVSVGAQVVTGVDGWRAAVLLVSGMALIDALNRAAAWLHGREAYERLFAHAREQLAEFIDGKEVGDVDHGSSATVHECWRRNGRSFSYTRSTGWLEGVRGSCELVHPGRDGLPEWEACP